MISGINVIMVALVFGEEKTKAEFEIRQGTIIEDKFNYIRVNFGKEPNNVHMLWEKKDGTPYNFIMIYPNQIVILLNTDNDKVIQKAIDEISYHFVENLTDEEKSLMQAMEDNQNEKQTKKEAL